MTLIQGAANLVMSCQHDKISVKLFREEIKSQLYDQ